MRLSLAAAVMLLSLVPASPAESHHGWSSYDAAKTLTIEAPLASLRWANPHGAATVRHEGKNWDVILAPVTRMEASAIRAATGRPRCESSA
jgi:hypothetical protein